MARVAALVLLTSCGQVTSAPTMHSTKGTVEAGGSRPSPTAVVASSGQSLSKSPCKLPLGIGRGQSGFIAYPSGQFAPDLSSDQASSPYHGPNSSSVGGLGVPTYDSAAARWLPVSRALVSPDGATYAYSELVFPPVGPTPINGPGPGPTGSRIHVVTVASAADHVAVDSPALWEAVAYTGRQIYLIQACLECGTHASGLWVLDTTTGALNQLVAPDEHVPIIWAVIGPDAAWATDPTGGLARFDFANRSVAVWFTVPGKSLRPIGLDANGLPIAVGDADYSAVGSSGGGAWLVTGPEQALQLAPESEMIDGAIADTHGIWLLSFNNDVYLWTSDGELTQISALSGLGDRGLAGPCQ